MASSLPESVAKFIEFIIDVGRMNNTLKGNLIMRYKELNFDLSKNPLGKLS